MNDSKHYTSIITTPLSSLFSLAVRSIFGYGNRLITLALLMLFFFSVLDASAKKVKVSDGTVIYTIDTSAKTASVTGYEKNASPSKVIILDYILNSEDGKSYKVTSIAKEAFQGSFFKNITLPSTIETIGSYAFATCSLKNLELPANLKTVGAYAFSDAYQSKNPVDLIIPAGCTSINTCAFNGCSIRSIRFNSKLTTLGDYSFGNTDITEVEVPACIKSLGRGVFVGCEKLTKATVKGTPAALPDAFFDGCTALSSVALPSTITSIGIWAFANCSSLKTLTLPASLKSIADRAFYQSGLTAISLPAGLQTIGEAAFEHIATLTEITIPVSVTSIGDYCFYDCPQLMTVTSPNPKPCTLGTCGFASETYSNAVLNIPAGSEAAYKYAREWGYFHCLYDFNAGVDNITEEDPTTTVVKRLKNGLVIERRDGDQIIRYDLSGKRIK